MGHYHFGYLFNPDRAPAPFPPASTTSIVDATIEDGTEGTLIVVYDNTITLSPTFDLFAFTIEVNSSSVSITGADITPDQVPTLEVIFTPPVVAGDAVTFTYDARLDAGFKGNDGKAIGHNLETVLNEVT